MRSERERLRLLANENVPGEAVEALRARGHAVVWIRTDAPGSSDRVIIARAVTEDGVLLTFDKDSGPRVAAVAVAVLESRSDWAGHFTVVGEHRLRMVPLPPQ